MVENEASLENAKGLADKIKELSSEDPSINKDLDDQIQKIEPPLTELVSLLNTRQSELQKVQLQSQELRDSVDEFGSWLTASENRFNLQRPISARHKLILEQQDRLQVSFRSLLRETEREREKKNTRTQRQLLPAGHYDRLEAFALSVGKHLLQFVV